MPKANKTFPHRRSHDPRERQTRPIFPLDLSKIQTIDDLVARHGQHRLHRRARSATQPTSSKPWAREEKTASSSMTSPRLTSQNGSRLLRSLDPAIVKAIVSTGAPSWLPASSKPPAFPTSANDPSKMDDNQLFLAGYNRVYDSLAGETNLESRGRVRRTPSFENGIPEIVCSWKLHAHRRISLTKHTSGRASPLRHDTRPVFVPAVSLPNEASTFALNIRTQRPPTPPHRPLLRFDPFEDF